MPRGFAQKRVHHLMADHIPVGHRRLNDEDPVRFRIVHAECADPANRSKGLPGNVIEGDFAKASFQPAALLQVIPEWPEQPFIEVFYAVIVFQRLRSQ